MSKKHLNYFSAKEQGFAKWFESWRTKIFLPISRLLNFFGITANMVSYFGFLILIGFIYFVPKDPIVAIYFLLAHVLIDAFDGPLSRLRKEDSDGGAFTDIMCDHTGMVIVVATLAYFSLIDPIISIAYVYLYTVMIIFVIVLNRVKVPLRLVFRTKYYVYILYAVWAIWGINYLDEGLLIFIVLMLPSVVGGFISLRKYLS